MRLRRAAAPLKPTGGGGRRTVSAFLVLSFNVSFSFVDRAPLLNRLLMLDRTVLGGMADSISVTRIN